MAKERAVDKYGNTLNPGDFFLLDTSIGPCVAGPYKYEGFKHGSHCYSIGDMSFFTSGNIHEHSVKLENWKRWREKKKHFERFEEYYESYAKGRLAGAAPANESCSNC